MVAFFDDSLYKVVSETYSCVSSVREAKKMDQGTGNKKRILQMVLSTILLVGVTSIFVIIGAKG